MAKPFDATLKALVESYPRDWLDQLGLSAAGTVDVIDADVSTVSAQADKVLRSNEPEPWVLHLELQASRDPTLPRRMLKYNVLLHDRHDVTVKSVVVLLRPEAAAPGQDGVYGYGSASEGTATAFHYRIVRLWEQPVEALLAGGVGTLPLAPLSGVGAEALPGVVRRMADRLDREVALEEAGTLWTATYILMGLRYSRELTAQLIQGVRAMKESVTYQAILEEGREEGRAEEARRVLLRLGALKFGPADASVLSAVEAITDVDRLEELAARLFSASGWQDLLAAS